MSSDVQPRAVPTNGIWRTVKQGSNPHSSIGSNQDDVHLGRGHRLFHSDGRSAHISSRHGAFFATTGYFRPISWIFTGRRSQRLVPLLRIQVRQNCSHSPNVNTDCENRLSAFTSFKITRKEIPRPLFT
jgi:hypothetical protein